MSIFHRVKCAGADLADFKTKVRAFLDKSVSIHAPARGATVKLQLTKLKR